MFFKSKKRIEELETKLSEIEIEKNKLKDKLSLIKENLIALEDKVLDSEEIDLRNSMISHMESMDKDISIDDLKDIILSFIDKEKEIKENNKVKNEALKTAFSSFDDYFEKENNHLIKINEFDNLIQNNLSLKSELNDDFSNMEDISKDISVASLNSAIEAGYMGEQGEKYIEVSEKIRVLSEQYRLAIKKAKEIASDIDSSMKDNKAKIEDIKKSIEKNLEYLKNIIKLKDKGYGNITEVTENSQDNGINLSEIENKISSEIKNRDNKRQNNQQYLLDLFDKIGELSNDRETKEEILNKIFRSIDEALKG